MVLILEDDVNIGNYNTFYLQKEIKMLNIAPLKRGISSFG